VARLKGTGWQVGHSVTLDSLVALFDGSLEKEGCDSFLDELASSLGVMRRELDQFFMGHDGRRGAVLRIAELARDTSAKRIPHALLIEAAYRLHWDPRVTIEKDQPKVSLLDCAPDPRKERANFLLETIRLRYRMQDTDSSERSQFRAGAYVSHSQVYLQIDRHHEYGSDRIVDLHEEKFAESTVPPAMLVHA
jgi:hypothetical protein